MLEVPFESTAALIAGAAISVLLTCGAFRGAFWLVESAALPKHDRGRPARSRGRRSRKTR